MVFIHIIHSSSINRQIHHRSPCNVRQQCPGRIRRWCKKAVVTSSSGNTTHAKPLIAVPDALDAASVLGGLKQRYPRERRTSRGFLFCGDWRTSPFNGRRHTTVYEVVVSVSRQRPKSFRNQQGRIFVLCCKTMTPWIPCKFRHCAYGHEVFELGSRGFAKGQDPVPLMAVDTWRSCLLVADPSSLSQAQSFWPQAGRFL